MSVKYASRKAATSTRGDESRDAILDAAETLFARHGPDGVSLRQISVASGSANNSAVQYHFGNREGLIRGIFDRRLQSLEKRREEMLLEVECGGAADVRRLLEVLLLPIADERDAAGRCSYAAFLLGLRSFGDLAIWEKYTVDLAPVTRRINRLLRAGLTALPEDVFELRRLAAVSAFLVAVVDWDRRYGGSAGCRPPSRQVLLDRILQFAAAGLVAPAE